jgi:crotonobetainyl-CoA:carnitine CoA-transferase CaiB-like acyl-CoA transferase
MVQKINGNLIRCHIQGFGKNPGGFEKNDPSAESSVL